MEAAAAVSVFLLAMVHVFIGRLRWLHGVPRSRWLSFAGGVAVAYVFLHILPELGRLKTPEAAPAHGGSGIYAAALAGLVGFYGLERVVKLARNRGPPRHRREAGAGLFWLHIGSFALYNLLIGYLLLQREEAELGLLAFYVLAMALHFVTSDFDLREDYPGLYDRRGRWLLSAALIAGWLIGLGVALNPTTVGICFAVLAGGMVLNVLKEELPEERQSRFGPFAGGAFFYGALLLFIA